jgi:myosin heavy subunit
MEQALYESEGVAIEGIQFVDNQATLDLLEARNTGIFSLCDEEISMPKGTDETFLQKIFSRHVDSKHPSCIRPKSKDCKDSLKNFGVLHYAGPVFYNVTAFLEKNKDQLHSDILNALRASTSPLLQKMFPTKSEDGTASG